MKPLLEAQRAHLNLLHAVPRERIRTHEQRAAPTNEKRWGGKCYGLGERRERIMMQIGALLCAINPRTGKQWTCAEIGSAVGLSKGSVAKYGKRIRARDRGVL